MSKEKLARLLPKKPEYVPNPRKLHFWRDSFLYFWVFSFVGHLLEFPWIALMNLLGQNLDFPPFFVIAAPYGFGALAILWFVYPVLKDKKIGLLAAYIYGVVICTAVEFISALIPYIVLGYNRYWDYTDAITVLGHTIPLNLFGFVCLKNSLAFGVAALLFLYILFPLTDRFMKWLGQKKLNIIFWILFVGYIMVHLGELVTTGTLFTT